MTHTNSIITVGIIILLLLAAIFLLSTYEAIQEVFARYPEKKAGVTLGNTFPSLDFRRMVKEEWENPGEDWLLLVKSL